MGSSDFFFLLILLARDKLRQKENICTRLWRGGGKRELILQQEACREQMN